MTWCSDNTHIHTRSEQLANEERDMTKCLMLRKSIILRRCRFITICCPKIGVDIIGKVKFGVGIGWNNYGINKMTIKMNRLRSIRNGTFSRPPFESREALNLNHIIKEVNCILWSILWSELKWLTSSWEAVHFQTSIPLGMGSRRSRDLILRVSDDS